MRKIPKFPHCEFSFLLHSYTFSIFQDDPDQFGYQILHNVSLSNNGSLVIWPWLLSIGDNIGLFPIVFGDRLRYGTFNDSERISKDLYIMEETVKNYIYGYPWCLKDKTLSRPYSWPSEGLLELTGEVKYKISIFAYRSGHILRYSHGQKLFTFTKQVLSKLVSRKIISAKIG